MRRTTAAHHRVSSERVHFSCAIAVVVASASLISCATTTVAPVAVLQTGELEPAAPASNTDSRANTEASAAVALSSRRDRVRDAIDSYLRAIVEQDADRAMTIFTASPTLIDSNGPYRAVADLSEHHRRALSGPYDIAFLRLELEREGGGVVIRSQSEFRRLYPGGYLAVQPGDWVVELPFTRRAPYTAVARYMPYQLVFRFVGAVPKVVALSTLIPLRA